MLNKVEIIYFKYIFYYYITGVEAFQMLAIEIRHGINMILQLFHRGDVGLLGVDETLEIEHSSI